MGFYGVGERRTHGILHGRGGSRIARRFFDEVSASKKDHLSQVSAPLSEANPKSSGGCREPLSRGS